MTRRKHMLDKRITFGGEVVPAWIASEPKIIKPKRKMTVTAIAGSNREVVEMEDAWESYEQPYTMFIGDGTENFVQDAMDDVARVLYKTGWQTLMDGYDTTHFRLACFEGSFDVDSRHTIAGKFDISFRCRPERFLLSGNVGIEVESGDSVFNPTAYTAKPLIHVTGSGNGTLTVNGTTMAISNMVDYLNIDCDKQDTYRLPAENRNSLVTGNYPTLSCGGNLVAFTGGITGVTITPRYWTL